jgi:prevent-host-death family protein
VKTEIGAYEAKTRLPELLRLVRAGRQFTITNRGKAIADLVPSASGKRKDKAAAVEQFRVFIRKNPVRGAVRVKDLIADGRA